MSAFETAIIFVLKRKSVVEYLVQQQQQSTSEWSKVSERVEGVEEAVGDLTDEMKSLKVSARQTRNQMEKINERLSLNDLVDDDNKKTSGVDCATTTTSTAIVKINDKLTKNKEKKFQQHSCFIC